jgi:protein-S-isoprenylcysteine O-methyltransferase Ste14
MGTPVTHPSVLLRHLLSITLLPFLVVVVVPWALLDGSAEARPADHSLRGLRAFAGVAVFVWGFAFFAWCVSLFARVGRGTLAPWDPTRRLVVAGPYRYVRNPMISGVALMLLGEAVFWGSGAVGLWAASFLAINHLYFVLSEEPGLERRFGEEYRAYKAAVPRWIPRLRPWAGAPVGDSEAG